MRTVRLRRLKKLDRAMLGLVLTGLVSACSSGAIMVREDAHGGLVAYSFKEESEILSSHGRREALRLMAQRCQQGFTILREGEMARVRPDIDRQWRGQLGEESLWGIRFQCR